jgi:hypothetical protein
VLTCHERQLALCANRSLAKPFNYWYLVADSRQSIPGKLLFQPVSVNRDPLADLNST